MDYINETALAHYGVKGMKWGVRRFNHYSRSADRNTRRAAKASSEATRLKARGNTEGAARAKQRADQYRAKAKFKEEVGRVNAFRGTGKKLLTNVLAGPFANRSYQSLIAAGKSRTAAAGITYVSACLAGPIGPIAVAHFVAEDAYNRNRQR